MPGQETNSAVAPPDQNVPPPDLSQGAPSPAVGQMPTSPQTQAAVNNVAQAPPDSSAVPPQRSAFSKILHAIGDAFAPPTRDAVDPGTGAIVKQPLDTAQRVVGGVGRFLTAAGPALAQHGPGSFGRSIEAGNDAVTQQQQQQKENVLAQSKNTQATIASQAARAMQTQQMAESAWRMQREQTSVDEGTADKLNTAKQLVSADPRNHDWGNYSTFGDFLKAHSDLQENGVNLAQLQAQGKIMAIPTTENGKITGVHVFEINPDAMKQKTDAPTTISRPVGLDDKGNVQYKDFVIPAGTEKGNIVNFQLSTAQDDMTASEKAIQAKREAATSQSTIDKNRADTAKTVAETKNLQMGNAKDENGNWNPASLPVSLVEANMDPTQLSKRSTDYNAKLQAANQYSIEKYGKPFDIAQAQSDYKYATSTQTQNTLKMINGMTEPGGAIQIAQNTANNLPQFNSTVTNKIFNAAATEFGSSQASNFHTAMLGLADEYSKVMGGGTGSDTGRQQGLDLLKAAYSKGQLSGAIGIMQNDIAARKSALVGNNRYLQKQYGAVAPPAGAPHNVVVNGRVVGVSTDGGKTMTPVAAQQ